MTKNSGIPVGVEILNITEFCDYDNINEEGFKIKTTGGTLVLFIENFVQCCEYWGYLMSEEDTSKYIGATLLGVEVVDEELNVTNLSDKINENYSETYAIFINILTNKGVLQFVAYNEHNGYYGHNTGYRFIQGDDVLEEYTDGL